MISISRWSTALLLGAMMATPASAQQSAVGDRAGGGAAAATTVLGDTGLWFVSSADVLPAGVFDLGVIAASDTRGQDSRKASYGAASIARGIAGRAEVFGSWQLRTELDGRHGRGDVLAGAKYVLLSQRRTAPVSMSARAVLKLPAGDETAGVSTGTTDLLTEIVATRQFGPTEITGSTGMVWRADRDAIAAPNGVRTGIGVALLAHRSVRVFTELHGERYLGGANSAHLVSPLDVAPTAAAGVSWRFADRLSVSAGVNRAIGGRSDTRGVGAVVRVGYRPGAHRVSAAAPLGPAIPAADLPPPAAPTADATTGAGSASSARDIALGDVHFDFDRYTLRPDALPLLDRAVEALRDNPGLRLQIDGHTCELGTAEYNLALGDRRAHAVREYLINRGIAAERLLTTSFGEERPKHDISSEATRALNRRAELLPRY